MQADIIPGLLFPTAVQMMTQAGKLLVSYSPWSPNVLISESREALRVDLQGHDDSLEGINSHDKQKFTGRNVRAPPRVTVRVSFNGTSRSEWTFYSPT